MHRCKSFPFKPYSKPNSIIKNIGKALKQCHYVSVTIRHLPTLHWEFGLLTLKCLEVSKFTEPSGWIPESGCSLWCWAKGPHFPNLRHWQFGPLNSSGIARTGIVPVTLVVVLVTRHDSHFLATKVQKISSHQARHPWGVCLAIVEWLLHDCWTCVVRLLNHCWKIVKRL